MDGNMEGKRSIVGIVNQVPWTPFLLACIIITLAPAFHCQASCPSGSIGRLEYCYTLHNEPLSWQLASSECGFDGGFLTSIVNKQENDFLVESFGYLTSLAWIGMDSSGRWLDGSNSRLFYNNFRYETLNTLSCSVIDLDRNGRWNVSSCLDSRLDFICKKNKVVSGGRDSPAPTTGDDEEEEEGLSAKSILIIVFTLIFFIVITIICSVGKCAVGKWFCSCSWDMLVLLCKCIVDMPTRLCGWIYERLCVLGLSIQVCFYRCLRCGGLCKRRQEGTEGATSNSESNDPETREPLNCPPLAETGPDDQPRATPSAPAEPHTDPPPPAYGDVTSDRPLPSFSSTPRIRGPLGRSLETNNHPQSTPTAPPPSPPPDDRTAPPSYDAALDPNFDIRPTNIRDETTAAPSYESVARS